MTFPWLALIQLEFFMRSVVIILIILHLAGNLSSLACLSLFTKGSPVSLHMEISALLFFTRKETWNMFSMLVPKQTESRTNLK